LPSFFAAGWFAGGKDEVVERIAAPLFPFPWQHHMSP
jgi:hypothetical protein